MISQDAAAVAISRVACDSSLFGRWADAQLFQWTRAAREAGREMYL